MFRKGKPGSATKQEGEVLPVAPELVPRIWKSVVKVVLSKIPGYEIERTHARLLVGVDQLWVAFGRNGNAPHCLTGVIITSISDRPPSNRKCFQRKDPALMKSLTVHVAGESQLPSWLPSAVERIGQYARNHGCRQLFLLTRKRWHTDMKRFYSREWEAVAIARDRRTYSRCKRLQGRNTPGYFRLMVPVAADRFDRYMYNFMGTFYFKEAA